LPEPKSELDLINRATPAVLAEENVLLREEVRVARRASEITAKLVVDQFVKIEKMLQRIADSENRSAISTRNRISANKSIGHC